LIGFALDPPIQKHFMKNLWSAAHSINPSNWEKRIVFHDFVSGNLLSQFPGSWFSLLFFRKLCINWPGVQTENCVNSDCDMKLWMPFFNAKTANSFWHHSHDRNLSRELPWFRFDWTDRKVEWTARQSKSFSLSLAENRIYKSYISLRASHRSPNRLIFSGV
jgi:hypothetical protein